MPDTFTLLGFLGSAIGIVVVVPQIARIVRNPETAGVSAATWGLSVVACSLWLTYGLRTGEAPQVPGNVILIAGATAITLLVPHPWSARRRALVLGAVVTGLALLLSQAPAETVGYAAFVLAMTSMWPQVFESYATYRVGAVSAVSVSSMGLRVGSQVCWLTYAIGTSDHAVTLTATLALTTALLVIGFEQGARSRGARRFADATA